MLFSIQLQDKSGYGMFVSLKNGNFVKIFSNSEAVLQRRVQQTMLRISAWPYISCKTSSKSLNLSVPTLICKMEILIMSTIYVKCMAQTSAQ